MKPSRPLSIAAIYLAGFVQGAAFVLIPALGNTLTAAPYHFSASAYAFLFLPQTVGAILGAALAGFIQQRLDMARLFRLGLGSNLLAMLLLLAASHGPAPMAYPLFLGDSLFMGLGFGWTLAAINHYSAIFFSQSASTAITLLNALIGGATALSPLILTAIQVHGNWGIWPLVLAAGFILAGLPYLPKTGGDTQLSFWPRQLSPYFFMVLIYAVCEGSFGSWASVYLSKDQHLGNHAGTLALSAFWGSMTLFRTLLAPLPEHMISRRTLLLASATGMMACFALLPWLSGVDALIGAFAFAGASCSIYYPFTMALGLANFEKEKTQVAGLMVAALMIGEGLGSYGLGWLQSLQPLSHIYLVSALWGIPLLIGGWHISTRTQTVNEPGLPGGNKP